MPVLACEPRCCRRQPLIFPGREACEPSINFSHQRLRLGSPSPQPQPTLPNLFTHSTAEGYTLNTGPSSTSPKMDDEARAVNREANIKETIRFWRAWKTVHQMCQDRVRDNSSSPMRDPRADVFCS